MLGGSRERALACVVDALRRREQTMARAKQKTGAEHLEGQSKSDLEQIADDRDLEVEGSGKDGNVLKSDLVEAIASGPDEFGQVSNPDLVQGKRDAAMDAVRERHSKIREHWRRHNRTEVVTTIQGVGHDGDDAAQIRVSTAEGRIFISCSALEVVLDHDGAADLVRFANQAFQAVS